MILYDPVKEYYNLLVLKGCVNLSKKREYPNIKWVELSGLRFFLFIGMIFLVIHWFFYLSLEYYQNNMDIWINETNAF